MIVGSKDSIPTGSYHLVSKQGFQSGLSLSFLACVFDFVLVFVLAETSYSRVCVS